MTIGWLEFDVLMKKDPLKASEGELKVLMNLLARELIIAPSEEECIWLSGYISSLKERALTGPKLSKAW